MAALLVRHVQLIAEHVSGGGRVRMWDPLFRALVDAYRDIELEVHPLERGVRVRHRGTTPAARQLVRAHAEVVSAFVRDGRAEAQQEHAVPEGG